MNRNTEGVCAFSSDEEDDLLLPTADMINQYNREYSMIVKQVEHFLKDTNECIQRFVVFHNFGVNLNLPNLLSNLVNIETSFKNRLSQTQSKQGTDPKQIARQKYESSFNRVIQRMGDIFHDLMDCQLEFKKQYFGIKRQEETHQSQERARTVQTPIAYSISSITKSSTSEQAKLQEYIQSEKKEERREAELRVTLNEKLKPKVTLIQRQCKEEYSTTENLYRLNQKIDQFITDIKSTRVREEKLIELFNLNRVKKMHAIEQPIEYFTSSNISTVSPPLDQGEKDMDSILQNWRMMRKDSDTFTEHECKNKRFFKKRIFPQKEP